MGRAVFRKSDRYPARNKSAEAQEQNGNGRSLLTVENLCAWYNRDKTVLSDFSVELKEHEVTGLIGLNGAGKTTFIKTLSGLHENFSSDGIRLHGCPVRLRDNMFKTCRYTVFSEDNSFQYFTFREYLSYVFAAYRTVHGTAYKAAYKATDKAVYKTRNKEAHEAAYGEERNFIEEAAELIQGFHFEDYTDILLKDLSTGNKKKAFLITAFALKPELLLLDEPVNGLDFQSTEFLYRLIAEYKKYGTVLFSSHILESITLTSDRVLVLENGHIRQTFEGSQINANEIREVLRYENDI